MYRNFSSNIIILGDGLLAKEINSKTNWRIISRKINNFDITKIETYNLLEDSTTIINCIAHTDTYSTNKDVHWKVNYEGVYNLVEFCNKFDKKLVHITTDFIYANNKKKSEPTEDDVPVHSEDWYSYTKLLSDGLIQLISKNYLICRSTHKPNPLPYDTIFEDRIGNFDYVNKIADLIIQLIIKNKFGVFNVGTEIKSMVDLVKYSQQDYKIIKAPDNYPKKTVMNIDKLKKELNLWQK